MSRKSSLPQDPKSVSVVLTPDSLQANAKNRMGGYTGLKRTAFLINNNKIVNAMTDAPFCNGLTYYPLTGL